MRKCVLLVLLDRSAAFDTVNRHILLYSLRTDVVVCGTAVQQFRSYLSQRTQVVRIGKITSESRTLECEVPQGSVLGPILFTICPDHGLVVHLCEDDTQLYLPCDVAYLPRASARGETCVRDIRQWMVLSKPNLRDDKTIALFLRAPWHASRGQVSLRLSLEESLL